MGEICVRAMQSSIRHVALKILPDIFFPILIGSRDSRVKRWVVAALNHPHIAAFTDSRSQMAYRRSFSSWSRVPRSRIASAPDRFRRRSAATDARRRRTRRRARAVDHPPRSEAGEYQAAARRDGQDSRLRLREVLEPTFSASVDVSASPTITSPAMTGTEVSLLGTAAHRAQAGARPARRSAR